MMPRIAIFAHFDAHNEVKPYISYYLEQLRSICENIVFVSTSELSPTVCKELKKYCSEVLLKDNRGYDFGMWKYAIERTPLEEYDELVLANSSVFGPIWPFKETFNRMSLRICDFWGMTDSYEIEKHIQSYFLVFRRHALHSEAFRRYWDAVFPYSNKNQIIRSYEVGLEAYFTDNGFRSDVVVAAASLSRECQLKKLNPTLAVPLELLDRGMPLVKVDLLRSNPLQAPIAPVVKFMTDHQYPPQFISFDRPSAPKRIIRERITQKLGNLVQNRVRK
jgi:lipopolysaccharide biosynthesis protein